MPSVLLRLGALSSRQVDRITEAQGTIIAASDSTAAAIAASHRGLWVKEAIVQWP